KSIRDTAALLDSMQVVQPAAAFQTSLYEEGYLQSLTPSSKKSFKVAFSLSSPIGQPVSPESKKAVLNAVKWLELNGFEVEEDSPDIDGIDLMKSYYVMNSGETATMLGTLEKSTGRPVTQEDVELLTWVLFQAGKSLGAVDYSNALLKWDDAAEKVDTFSQEYDLYLQPTTAETAPRIDRVYWNDAFKEKMRHIDSYSPIEQQQLIWEMWEESLTMTPFTQQANLTGQPSISLPTHLTEEGLPLGIQLTAPKGKEHWLLQIGHLMESDGFFC
ncbi:MAG: amidase family protein, partial [Alkalibacterium sp.]|uniref:amidase family protein n=1 Tax=Alkalibacterium sp. TaxID=1872447 RepID=UPI003970E6AB